MFHTGVVRSVLMKKLKAILLSVGIMTAVSAILLALAALILGKMGALPKAAVPVLTTVIGCIAVFLGGFFSSMYSKEKGMLFGLISGGVFAACITAAAIFAFQAEFALAGAAKLAAFLLSGCIGGILGVNRKGKVKF